MECQDTDPAALFQPTAQPSHRFLQPVQLIVHFDADSLKSFPRKGGAVTKFCGDALFDHRNELRAVRDPPLLSFGDDVCRDPLRKGLFPVIAYDPE